MNEAFGQQPAHSQEEFATGREIPPEILEWAKDFDEAELVAGILEIRQTGGLALEDFILDLEAKVSAHE